MSKFIVETFYTCTFKIVHKLDELSEKKLSELENRKDGEVQIIDVKLNNRKTKTENKNEDFNHNNQINLNKMPGVSKILNEKITTNDKIVNSNESGVQNINTQIYNKKNNDRYKMPDRRKEIIKSIYILVNIMMGV